MDPRVITIPFNYNYGVPTDPPCCLDEGTLDNDIFKLTSGGQFLTKDGRGWTMQGDCTSGKWHDLYAAGARPEDTDGGLHPQNLFRLYSRQTFQNMAGSVIYRILKYNLSTSSERKESNGLFLFARATPDGLNGYYGGLRVDGTVVIKKKQASVYTTMFQGPIFPGTYNRTSKPNLLPINAWLGLKLETKNLTGADTGKVAINVYMDKSWTGVWTKIASAVDKTTPFLNPGLFALRTDFMDAEFDCFKIENPL